MTNSFASAIDTPKVFEMNSDVVDMRGNPSVVLRL
jgi:hypothetical protein